MHPKFYKTYEKIKNKNLLLIGTRLRATVTNLYFIAISIFFITYN